MMLQCTGSIINVLVPSQAHSMYWFHPSPAMLVKSKSESELVWYGRSMVNFHFLIHYISNIIIIIKTLPTNHHMFTNHAANMNTVNMRHDHWHWIIYSLKSLQNLQSKIAWYRVESYHFTGFNGPHILRPTGSWWRYSAHACCGRRSD